MEDFINNIDSIKEIILDLLRVIPEILTLPVVVLLIFILFKDPISKLINSLAQYISLKTAKANVVAPPQQQRQYIASPRETSTHVHQNLAQAYAIKGSYDDAIAQYKAAVKLDPENVSAFIGLGNAFYKKGMHSDAISALERAVEIKPYWADCRCNLGAAYSLAGMHDNAVEEFVQAININPNYAAAHYGLGIAYISAGNLNKAAEQVEILKELDSSFADKLNKSIEDAQVKTSSNQEKQESGQQSPE